MTAENESMSQPTGITRRTAVTRVAVGTAAVWAAPVITGLGGRAFAAGSPQPGQTTFRIRVDVPGAPQYTHNYSVTYTSATAFSGTGPGNSDSGPETVFGTYDGTTLVLHADYATRSDNYNYDLTATVQANGDFDTTSTSAQNDSGNQGSGFRLTGHVFPA
jgi:hypothetical protein